MWLKIILWRETYIVYIDTCHFKRTMGQLYNVRWPSDERPPHLLLAMHCELSEKGPIKSASMIFLLYDWLCELGSKASAQGLQFKVRGCMKIMGTHQNFFKMYLYHAYISRISWTLHLWSNWTTTSVMTNILDVFVQFPSLNRYIYTLNEECMYLRLRTAKTLIAVLVFTSIL